MRRTPTEVEAHGPGERPRSADPGLGARPTESDSASVCVKFLTGDLFPDSKSFCFRARIGNRVFLSKFRESSNYKTIAMP